MRPVTAILLAAIALGGCASKDAPAPISQDASASPVIYADQGLEVRWWVVSDRHGDLARVLAPHEAAPTAADADALARWERSGLRLIAVPLDELTAVRDALPKVGATNSQWLGESATWLDALGGPVLNREWTVVLDESTVTLEPGQLRLLVRAWMTPELTDIAEARLHVELMPQHRSLAIEEAELDDRMLRPAPRHRTRDIDALRLAMDVGPDHALLVVPEQPGVRWDREAPGPDEDATPIGPTPTYPTLGGAMLTGSPSGLSASANKAVIVLLPRVPERFELTAR